MQRRTPGGIWALRAVSAVITVIVVLAVGVVAYSAYEDYGGVRQELAGGLHPVAVVVTPEGSGAKVSIAIEVPNRGLVPLNLTAACEAPPSGVTCAPAGVVIRPGETGTLNFTMTVADVQAFSQSANHAVNGTVTLSLEPFVTLSVGADFGSFIPQGVA